MAWITSASSRESYAPATSHRLTASRADWLGAVLRSAAAPKAMLLVLLILQLSILAATVMAPATIPTTTLAASVACISAVIIVLFARQSQAATLCNGEAFRFGPAQAGKVQNTSPQPTRGQPDDINRPLIAVTDGAGAHSVAQVAARAPFQDHSNQQTWNALLHQVHHDLRTPLNAVIGFTDLMQKETFGPVGSPRYVEYLAHIRDSGEALLKSTEQTLAMTSALAATDNGQGRTAPVTDLKATALAAWHDLTGDTGATGFSLDLHGPALLVHADQASLARIFHHLFQEAMARSETSGRLTLSIVPSIDSVRIEVASAAPLAAGAVGRPSLDMCIARTLLQLYGGTLISMESPGHRWRAATILDRAVQADSFDSTMDEVAAPAAPGSARRSHLA